MLEMTWEVLEITRGGIRNDGVMIEMKTTDTGFRLLCPLGIYALQVMRRNDGADPLSRRTK